MHIANSHSFLSFEIWGPQASSKVCHWQWPCISMFLPTSMVRGVSWACLRIMEEEVARKTVQRTHSTVQCQRRRFYRSSLLEPSCFWLQLSYLSLETRVGTRNFVKLGAHFWMECAPRYVRVIKCMFDKVYRRPRYYSWRRCDVRLQKWRFVIIWWWTRMCDLQCNWLCLVCQGWTCTCRDRGPPESWEDAGKVEAILFFQIYSRTCIKCCMYKLFYGKRNVGHSSTFNTNPSLRGKHKFVRDM